MGGAWLVCRSMSRRRVLTGLVLSVVPAVPTLAACSSDDDRLVVYSGRTSNLIGPLLEDFADESGISIDVRYGDSADLALLIDEEGDRTPADVFISQSPGAVGFLDAGGRLAELSDELIAAVPEGDAAGDNGWVGLSGRVRTLVYNPELVDATDLPDSVLDLTAAEYAGQVALAPTNGSFQDFVTVVRDQLGDDEAAAWLDGMAAGDPPTFDNNTAIVEAVGRGEVPMGLVNHYYAFRAKAEDPDLPVENHYFPDGDLSSSPRRRVRGHRGAVHRSAALPGVAQPHRRRGPGRALPVERDAHAAAQHARAGLGHRGIERRRRHGTRLADHPHRSPAAAALGRTGPVAAGVPVVRGCTGAHGRRRAGWTARHPPRVGRRRDHTARGVLGRMGGAHPVHHALRDAAGGGPPHRPTAVARGERPAARPAAVRRLSHGRAPAAQRRDRRRGAPGLPLRRQRLRRRGAVALRHPDAGHLHQPAARPRPVGGAQPVVGRRCAGGGGGGAHGRPPPAPPGGGPPPAGPAGGAGGGGG